MEIRKHELKVGDAIRWSERRGAGFARYGGTVESIEAGGEEAWVILTRAGGTAKLQVGERAYTGFGGGKIYRD